MTYDKCNMPNDSLQRLLAMDYMTDMIHCPVAVPRIALAVPHCRAQEKLTRGLLNFPKRPAVILANSLVWKQDVRENWVTLKLTTCVTFLAFAL